MHSRQRADPAQARADELSPAAARVLRRFRVVFNEVKAHFRAVEKKAGIAGAQLWALKVIRDRPGIGVSELARSMDIHQSTASNLLKQLIAADLVVADRAHADRRMLHLQVSAAGARLLKKAPGPFTGVLPDALSQLDARTLARLDRDLGALIELLGVNEKWAQVPMGQPDD
ncbi:MarR family transcriptional regulator [Ramlibacter sp. AW1]|uniref:MarR family transcriptional regulator n=1 Tax=Ramlibacter aurantiacus TaxID=2801330 RepID=A0A936ZR20_9BURK|nr:MarR family transcriptional regulator [Ramlibacter aurantiacus]MBL0419114.1 MarR family transcriptional regulator [Ramlibacter aurantiacus]